MVLNLDFATFTGKNIGFVLEHGRENGQFVYLEKEQGTQHFRRLGEVFIKKEDELIKFLTIEIEPRVSFISPDIIKVKIENQFLYFDFLPVLREFLDLFKISFLRFTRLDICFDFQNLGVYSGFQVLENFALKKWKVKGKSKFSAYGNSTSWQGVKFGSRLSPVSITIYNKTEEMKAKISKEYISAIWEKNGMDISKPVYRLEFCLKPSSQTEFKQRKKPEESEFQKKFEENFLTEIEAVKKIIPMFKFLTKTNFQVLEAGKRSNRSQSINLIPLAKMATSFEKLPVIEKVKSLNYKKYLIRSLANEAIFSAKTKPLETHFLLEKIHEMIIATGLQKWAKENLPYLKMKQTGNTLAELFTSEILNNNLITFTLNQSNLIYEN